MDINIDKGLNKSTFGYTGFRMLALHSFGGHLSNSIPIEDILKYWFVRNIKLDNELELNDLTCRNCDNSNFRYYIDKLIHYAPLNGFTKKPRKCYNPHSFELFQCSECGTWYSKIDKISFQIDTLSNKRKRA